ncbi:MAG: TldE/PmbA family protein [Burkholderiales bacterium]|nr:TldE/PmbA family protein [Burkholderiales bacterium]
MQQYFNLLADHVQTQLQETEQSTCWLSAESSDFVRFNRSAIRQPGHVQQSTLRLQLIQGTTHASYQLNLSGDAGQDVPAVNDALTLLREQLPDLPADPHLLLTGEVQNSCTILPSSLPPADQMVAQIMDLSAGYDMVGLLTTGSQYRGFANSAGQRNWFETSNVNFDWSLFHAHDKAVKSNYAGFGWDEAIFRQKFHDAANKLALLARPAVTIAPGNYRVYLTPTALSEIIGMLNWGGLSEQALQTRHSALRRLQTGEVQLHPMVQLSESSSTGLAEAFQAQGFIKPEQVDLFRDGKLAGSMISPRSAKEYGLISNGAASDEAAVAMVMGAGHLPQSEVLKELGTGIYISNLWYLNFSDRANCRFTGMTRFATFWVENGEIKAPLNVMRFDDSLFRILGDNLLALTQETEVIMDDRSYGERRTGGMIVPGALLKEMHFAL